MLVLRVGAPVIGVGPGVRLVMRDDVIAGPLEVIVDPLIEFFLCGFAHVASFDELDEARHRALDEQQRRRLERLDEALRQPDGQAVLVPVI